MGESPFTLVYGCEAISPIEVRLPSYKISHFTPTQNNRALEEHLDLIEEKREMVRTRLLQEKMRAERYFNKRVKPKTFKVDDLFLKRSKVTTQNEGKLRPHWERPYLVVANNRSGS